ncbi:hypothetical protein GCM10007858_47550 [Bradyrhizobium liaoningense]|nr:hypothetical protein GCM10007858_47550 [Bradyrhizobium liaoningense]
MTELSEELRQCVEEIDARFYEQVNKRGEPRRARSFEYWSEPRKLLQEWVESVTSEEMDHEIESVHGRADHRDFAGAGGGCGNG